MGKTTGVIVPKLFWRNAEHRLDIMEEEAYRALQARADMARIVVPVEETPVPVLLPARIAGILYGPDGRPMKE